MFKDILLAVDVEDAGSWKKPVEVATEYARAFNSNLHIMTVVPDFGMSIVSSYFPADYEKKMVEKTTEMLHKFVKEHVSDDIHVQHIVGLGSIYEEILRVSEEISSDLIIMGTHRPKMQDYLLGPNAARVTRHAACSVMVVRD
ncbi:universal stress protein [Sneathiella chungangensis]|uniref:Universal stress protein n=1 Tax=Sneathiella chungangensis TaxID=1418234 RepID=A0A845MDK4_9PROT|nr:universal stress protein [Sneathiella chungangensis]MZR21751.1 universal stress protein [Sneathiella chungangensis]